MQIIAKHWTEALIKTPAKPVNAPLIEEFTGVSNYKGRADQIETVMEHITAENYANMRERVCNLHLFSPMLYYYLGGRKIADYRDTNLQHFFLNNPK